MPDQFNYQGILRGVDGNPIADGEYDMVFRIYDDLIPTANVLWIEDHSGVAVYEGRFGVTLGYSTPIPTDLFSASPDRFVGVTVDSFAEMAPRLRLSAVPYAFQSEHAANGVPVGAVIDWWRPDASLNDTTLPNLADKFVRGVTDVNAIGTSGGSENHDHTGTTSTDGDHDHVWATWDNLTWSAIGNSGEVLKPIITWNNGMDADGTGYYPLAVDSTQSQTYYTDIDGSHDHTFQTTTKSHLPSYIGILKLCRIK